MTAVYENWPANWIKCSSQELRGWKSSQKLLRHSQIVRKDPALLNSQSGHSLCPPNMNPILSDPFHSSRLIVKSPSSPERAFNTSCQAIKSWVALSLSPTHPQVIWLWVRTFRVLLDNSKKRMKENILYTSKNYFSHIFKEN